MPIYTLPNAPHPINSPFLHRIGGALSLATEGEVAFENARDLRIHELIFSTSAPPVAAEVEATGGGVSSLSAAGRNTSDRRTEPKMSCIGANRKGERAQ